MTDTAPISEVRHQAIPTFLVEFLTVGDHVSTTVDTSGVWIAKPKDHLGFYFATCIKLQTLVQNVRYKIDTNPAGPAAGFQLLCGSETLIPVPNHGLSICAEMGQASIEYQWVR